MIKNLNLLQNIGQFDSVAAANLPLEKLSLIYAENGRGKTTLSVILRSLSSGNSSLILERHRIPAQHPPKAIITVDGTTNPYRFENGSWSSAYPSAVIFDDNFVEQNVYSGLAVGSDQRENLHELILGSNGIALNRALQQLASQVEEHNRLIRSSEAAITESMRYGLSVENFCALQYRDGIDADIANAERNLAAAQSTEAIVQQQNFESLALPHFDVTEINILLGQTLNDVAAAAAVLVQQHLEALGNGSETWVSQGMTKMESLSQLGIDSCPFCQQDLSGSSIISHYQAYFSDSYAELKRDIEQYANRLNSSHAENVHTAFERSIRVTIQRQQFWNRFTPIADIQIDTQEIIQRWGTAFSMVKQHLAAKKSAPLEPIHLSEEAVIAIERYNETRSLIDHIWLVLEESNTQIAILKQNASSSDATAAMRDLNLLKANRSRYQNDVNLLCSDYLNKKIAKAATEQLRNAARTDLDTYRNNIFQSHESAINTFLTRFNAGFRLAGVSAANHRGGSSCNYTVVINNTQVPLTSNNGSQSFRNTLSAGDRNTLALAFFFASLELDSGLADKVVVIDDPMTSLDEHRSLNTVHEIRNLSQRVRQMIVLSHSKPFLFSIWETSQRTNRTALKLTRQASGSTILSWNITSDSVTEHDKRHDLISRYIVNGIQGGEERSVAVALRPTLEAFMRVAYPDHFPPGSLLGPFIYLCEQRLAANQAILSQVDILEIRNLVDYANRFHHDSNPSWQTEIINDTQLQNFSERTLAFTRRR